MDSRGRDVVKDILWEDFNSPVKVDGWKAYSYLKTIQRRWDHFIRKVDAFMNTDHGRELSEEFYNMFKELKESLKSENIDDRKSMKNTYEKRMEELVKSYDPY